MNNIFTHTKHTHTLLICKHKNNNKINKVLQQNQLKLKLKNSYE